MNSMNATDTFSISFGEENCTPNRTASTVLIQHSRIHPVIFPLDSFNFIFANVTVLYGYAAIIWIIPLATKLSPLFIGGLCAVCI